MGAPLGNRNAAGSRGGSATRGFRSAIKKAKSRRTLAKLTGRKQRVSKMQLALRSGSGKTPSYAGLSWRASAARFKKKK